MERKQTNQNIEEEEKKKTEQQENENVGGNSRTGNSTPKFWLALWCLAYLLSANSLDREF